VDKGMVISDLRVVRKEGGKSGLWVEGENIPKEGEGEDERMIADDLGRRDGLCLELFL
jgi:hypothetical protein